MRHMCFCDPDERRALFHAEYRDTSSICRSVQKTAKEGVKVLAYDCDVTSDAIELSDAVDVVLGNPILKESVRPLVEWFVRISVIFRGERGLTHTECGFRRLCFSRRGWRR